MSEISELIDLLNKKGFSASFYQNGEQALKAALEFTADCDTVGVGGSQTLVQLNIPDMLLNEGKTVYSMALEKQKEDPDPDIYKKAMFADCYLTSTNALTKEGDLINIDGTGNRVAAMIFGPKKVGVFCGINKITEDPMTAVIRIKEFACPPNARRLGLNLPCALTDKCTDCKSLERMCNVVTRIQYPPHKTPIHIFLIGESLGY